MDRLKSCEVFSLFIYAPFICESHAVHCRMAFIRTLHSIYFVTYSSEAIVFFNPCSPANSIKNFKPQLHLALSHIRLNSQIAFSPSPVAEHSYDDNIISLCKKKLHREALQAFDIFQKCSNSPLNSITYTHLIHACSSLRSLEHGRKIHCHMSTFNYQPDLILQNHILNMYGKCGSLKEARNIFDAMPLKNAVSWTSMISGYSHYGQDDNAITLYVQMLRSGHIPDHFTFGSVVKSCSGLDDLMLARQLHAHVLKSEFGGNPIAQNALISMYTKFSQIADATNVFSHIITKNLISWGSMIAGFSQLGYEIEALCHFREMLSQPIYQPNEFVFGSAFSACSNLSEPNCGRQIHGLCIKFGLGRDRFAGCSLCDMYAKCGFLGSARTVFCQIEKPDLVAWNAIIAGFASVGDAKESLSFFSQMRHTGLASNDVTVLSLLCACSEPMMLNQGMQVHSYIVKTGFDLEVPVCNGLLSMYSKCSDLNDSLKIFEDIGNKADVVSWNTMLTVCRLQNQAGEVLRLMKLMLASRIKSDRVTLTNVLVSSGQIASYEVGSQVHCFIMKSGQNLDTSVSNALINMYMKCGSLGCAQKMFDSIDDPDVISWSSLIVGYAQAGCGEEAFKLFRTMRGLGIRPNEITFLGILTACCHIGMVEEGLRLYRTMQEQDGISPTKEHYSCIVDLLARAGCLDAAEDFIKKMPFEPDIVVWMTLLAACKLHGNLEVGKRAAENVLKNDPSNSAALVMLCNIHASSGRWKDFARIRRSMRRMDVSKVPGQSWIEIKDRVHVFFAEDSLHPERGRIYTMLEELMLQVLDDSCDPLQMEYCLGYKI
ncbi:pentatricopeptide repeat-containing protein At3g53360, mitochondrial [Cucurbita pepo subsp. pepo]|uniref:pentatricopeptide repeat-containing protein At3g53360, mitochondrial n=1 Tax=Cucurbita pepo subsp. pepo TaxID=3664 RepID=UPI000C9D300B|nr:pentatricopeptide repeat-containing protein At3g53360, mitochondrial [Cucurbita pepo subsp. pepo]XP_023526528.1 pentatricopeptide repeat-containing protein At3g53360, mitochondrial [Cucurbita pepo subsp. pepo]XP_023526529.1 pentatricopeptide repeat-containing protein At3g53360, mitochondrial [Cucurbita pepo subsp. pepo]